MHSTLTAKPGDDPHDVVVVAADAVRVAPSDEEELSSLLQQAAHHRSGTRAASDIAVGRVPPVDATFRPGFVDDVRVPGGRRSTAARALRGFMALLLTACIGVAAVGWKAYGDVAKRQIARWTTQFVLTSSLTSEQPASAMPPAPLAVPADAASPQPAPPAQAAAEAVAPAAAPSADAAPSLQSMARDLAAVTQQVEQLKASIAELTASQQQMSRDLAKASEVKASELKASETGPRPRLPAAPPRAVAARVRKPVSPYPPPQVLVPPPPQAAAPYVPRQTELQPQFAAEPPQADPELSSVPRPPMPLR
jgi:hypothetical protein